MLMILVALLALGWLVSRRMTLAEAGTERISRPEVTVRATVDGRRVRSYIMDRPQ